ncbi:MAG: hypothetical protein INR70_38485 [Parafilimonas terrae]|nr:hypothetical protein [Parafilimonas terrae]
MLVQVGSHYLNTDHIVSIEGTATGWMMTLVTGKSMSFPIGSLDPDDLCGTIVPAPAGMMLVEALLPSECDADREVRYRTSTVRAFRITEGTTAPVPIGAFGEPRSRPNYDYAVLQPDGQCISWEQIWDDLDAFKAEQQEWADGRHPSAAPAWLTQDRPQRVTLDPDRGL